MSRGKLLLVLADIWEQHHGGAEYQASLIEDEARTRGWQTFYWFISTGRELDKPQPPILVSARQNHAFFKLGNVKFPYLPALAKAMRKIRPDVIYQRGGLALTLGCANYANRNDCGMIFHVASDRDLASARFPWRQPLRAVDRALLARGVRKSKTIICQTQVQAEMARRRYGRQAIVIPNGRPIPQGGNSSRGKPVIAWIANWKPVKRPELFTLLVKKLQARINARYVMCGRIDRYMALAEHARSLGIEVAGEMNHDGLMHLLRESSLLVNTSTVEGFSNTFIEAWMHSVPVVSLGVDPDGKMASENIGICCTSLDEMAQAVVDLVTSNASRQEMGQRARQFAIHNYSMKNISAVVDVIDEAQSPDTNA